MSGTGALKRGHADAIADLVRAHEEIREIYAGMEGFVAETAPEAYQQRIIKQMYGRSAAALAKLKGGKDD